MAKHKYGFYAFLVLCWASGPFEMQVSGNPANWALASEIIEPEKRELGFALLGACTAMVGLLWGPICAYIAARTDPVLCKNICWFMMAGGMLAQLLLTLLLLSFDL